jgi:hypothetical protein
MRRDRDDETLPPEAALAFARFIRPAPLPWLWPHYIPHAQLTLLVGEPGVGKSLLAVDLAARISTASPWPDQPALSPAPALPAPPDTPPAPEISDSRSVHPEISQLSNLTPPPPEPKNPEPVPAPRAEPVLPPACNSPNPPPMSDIAFPWQPNPLFAYDPPPPGAPPEPGAVIIASAEDHPAEVIIPRLQAAGANLARIAILYGVHPHPARKDSVARLVLPDHFQALEGAVCATPRARLLILDPLHAFLSPAASSNPAILTGLLNRLADYARVFNIAILAVAHLSKSSRARTLYRIRGSVPLAAAARAAHLLTADPDDPHCRILVPFKSVHALRPRPLAFRIISGPPSDPPLAPRLDWTLKLSNYANRLPSDLLDADPEAYSALSEACEWLTNYLLEGPRPAAELTRDARTAGLCLRTLKTAKRYLRIRSRRAPGGPGWLWVPDQN